MADLGCAHSPSASPEYLPLIARKGWLLTESSALASQRQGPSSSFESLTVQPCPVVGFSGFGRPPPSSLSLIPHRPLQISISIDATPTKVPSKLHTLQIYHLLVGRGSWLHQVLGQEARPRNFLGGCCVQKHTVLSLRVWAAKAQIWGPPNQGANLSNMRAIL
jgi:hypothetical protein